MVVISRAFSDLLVVKGKYGVYAVIGGIPGETSDDHIVDPIDISHAMQADTRGFQAPSDDASCRALLSFLRPATGSRPRECAALSQSLTIEKKQGRTLRYPVSKRVYS